MKDEPAVEPDGQRTIWGTFSPVDATLLGRFYPLVGEDLIQDIANLINFPRLLEVTGVVEMVERYLEGSFSSIRDITIKLAANPLSLFYWDKERKVVRRVKLHETELMHGPMEKLALRDGSLQQINQLLDRRHGIQVTFGCSCCAIAVATENLGTLYQSSYYRAREGFGRLLDSDVLSVSGQLFAGVSVTDIPPAILARSADFHEAEVRSYVRLAAAARTALVENATHHDSATHMPSVRNFLLGPDQLEMAAE